MNSKLMYCLVAIGITIIIILVLSFQNTGENPTDCESSSQTKGQEESCQDAGSQVFQDLIPEEIMQVKSTSIAILGSQPVWEALAVIHVGNQVDPNVTEYVVGPLPEPTYHEDITAQKYGEKLSYSQRFVLANDFNEINGFLRDEYPKAANFMQEILNYNGSNIQYIHQLPPGLKSGDRKMWVSHFQNVTGYYLHPIGLEVQVDHSSLDVSEWKVTKVFYNGQYFEDMEDLERQFNKGKVRVGKVKEVPLDGGYSSLK
ncbi:AOC3: Amine oxidase [Crotalus adamanteus]|uniref:AOC3: Amine oxidase n=1 Tax=Crotalus adamanteus TaxID=8729 RepID=A0AAW1BHE9_CROAD